LQDSNIFVLPSYSEGFPMAVIEAMYMGLPVVVTENIGINKIINESKSGINVKKNQREIFEAILWILNNSELAKKMGEHGKQYVLNNLTIPKVAETMMNVYSKMLK